MATDAYLGFDFVEPNQSQPDVPLNAATQTLSAAQNASLSKTITSSDVTLTATEYENAFCVKVSGAFTAARNLIVPATKRLFAVVHGGTGGYNLTVKTSGHTGVTLSPNTTQILYCNGTDCESLTGATGSGGNPYDLSFSVEGLPGDGGVMLRFICSRAIRLPSGLTGSEGKSAVAATGSSTFTVKKNGSSIGTFNFGAAATTATFSLASDTDFTAGDILTIVAPSPQDATLADLAVTLAGIRL